MNLNERLKLAMSDPKVTGIALSKACKVSTATVSDWLSGEIKEIKSTNLLAAAKFLNISPEWLSSGVGSMRKSYVYEPFPTHTAQQPRADYNVTPIDLQARVPVISWVQAGAFCDMADANYENDAEEWINSPTKAGGRVFALKVRGLSMHNPAGKPSFSEGDIIYCDPDRQAEHKSLVICRLDDQKEATFKRLLIEGDSKMLEALNPSWPERIIKINGNATICGVVFGRYDSF